MLKRPALRPRPTARPPNISGAAETSVLAIALRLPKDPARRRAYAAIGRSGSKPVLVKMLETMMTTPATANASTIEYTGIEATAHFCARNARQVTDAPRRWP